MTSNESTNFTRRFSLVNHAGFAILLVLIGSMWAFHFPLSNDGPAHLYNTPIARALLFEPNSQLKNLYSLHWPVPNWTMTLVLVALETVVSPLTAAKLAVSLILLGSYFANRTFLIGAAGSERKSAAGILSLFFANTWFVWMGFWNFSLGTAFALFAASYARTRWLRWRGVHTLVLLVSCI